MAVKSSGLRGRGSAAGSLPCQLELRIALDLGLAESFYTTASFVHDHCEEVYLISGDLIVADDAYRGDGESFEAPAYACPPPGVRHGPFKSASGCMLFEIHHYEESKSLPPCASKPFTKRSPTWGRNEGHTPEEVG